MERKYFTIKDTAWFCISLYYSRKEWGRLIREIHLFCDGKKTLLEHYIILLSEENGEHVRLALSLSADKDLDAFLQETDDYFRTFMDRFPSSEPEPFRYGKRIWGNYPNNSIVWNRFELLRLQYIRYVDFSQATSSLLTDFLKDDFSVVNAFTTALFMCAKTLKTFSEAHNEKAGDLIYHVLKVLAMEVLEQSFVTGFNLNEKLVLYGIDYAEIMEVIGQYMEYGEEGKTASGTDTTYRYWENELKKIAAASPDSYLLINRFLWEQFDMNDTLKVLIMYLLQEKCSMKSNNSA